MCKCAQIEKPEQWKEKLLEKLEKDKLEQVASARSVPPLGGLAAFASVYSRRLFCLVR